MILVYKEAESLVDNQEVTLVVKSEVSLVVIEEVSLVDNQEVIPVVKEEVNLVGKDSQCLPTSTVLGYISNEGKFEGICTSPYIRLFTALVC